jgi:two-component system sporulation sensor kinase A
LGIPTCRKIVEAHGGKINVTSKIDHGTTVEIILPVKDAS